MYIRFWVLWDADLWLVFSMWRPYEPSIKDNTKTFEFYTSRDKYLHHW